MSMQATRQAITDAAATVDGITATDRQPEAPQVGHAWTVWASSRPYLPRSFDARWRLVVVLPDNADAAIDSMHELIDEVTLAIQTNVHGAAVDEIRPGRLDSGPNSPKVLSFDIRASTTLGD